MKISALITCFNEARRIREVLGPVLNSSLIGEVVVVDAASTDGTQKIIKEFQSPKLKTIFLPKKLGKGESLARGIKEIQGEVVFLCDADLKGLKQSHIQTLVEIFENRPYQMVVGLREKPFSSVSHWVRKNFLPLIAGERILPAWVLRESLKHSLSAGWGPEIYLNYYCRKKGIGVTKILLRGVNDLPKWKKGHGFSPFFYEAWDVARRYVGLYCIYFPRDLAQDWFSSPMGETEGFAEKKVKIDDIYINFARAGHGEKVLVLVHGWANNWKGWLPLAKFLKQKYTLYLVDLPGFGDSGGLEKYTIQKAAQYLAHFLEEENLYPEAVMGLSLGSLVTAYLGKIAPRRIKKIILLGAVFKGNRAMAAKILERTLEAIDGNTSAETFLKKIVETRTTAYLLAKYMNMHKFNRFLVDAYGMIGKKKMRKEAFVQMGISAAKFRLEKVLKNYPLPTLFIHGENDRIVSPEQARQCLPEGSFCFLSVPEAGHVVAWENLNRVAGAVSDFVEEAPKQK